MTNSTKVVKRDEELKEVFIKTENKKPEKDPEHKTDPEYLRDTMRFQFGV